MRHFRRLLLTPVFFWLIAFSALSQTATSQPQFITARDVTPGGSFNAAGLSVYGFRSGITTLGVDDFNRDGRPDILTTYHPNSTANSDGATSFALLLNNGNGTFSRHLLSNVVYPSNPTAFISANIADVDGDGRPDLVIVNGSGETSQNGDPIGPATLYVYLGNGDGTFRALAPQIVSSNLDVSVAIATDLNGDNKADLVINSFDVGAQLSTFSVLLNNGSGVFNPGPPLPSGGQFNQIAAAGDLYGQGHVDLVADFAILKNDGKANFTFGAALPFSGSTTVGDVNRDGRNDLIIATQDGPGCCTPFHAHVLLNQGNAIFKESAALPGVVAGGYLADVNHDGNKDYLANGRDGLVVFPGNGDGTFGFPANYATGGTIVVADFNGDGHLDALSSGGNPSPFLLALGDANGNFAAPRVTLTTDDPAVTVAIATGDFNGDKKPDIAVLSQGQCHDLPGGGPQPVVCPLGRVAVAAGTGLGYLQPPRFFSVGVPTGVMAVGDVNGDGKMDIVITRAANLPSNQTSSVPYDTSVLLGRGDGTFAPAMNFHLLGHPGPVTEGDAAIYLLDVNKDGKLDLVGDWGVAVGNGDGTFKAPIPLPAGLHFISGVTPGDFNRDGKLDLEIASFDQQTAVQSLVTLLGDGKGSFTIAHTVPFTAPGFPQGQIRALTAADVNGDGIPDLLYTGSKFNNNHGNTIDSGLHVQLGRGDGSFAPEVTYPGVNGFYIFAADFNRDGLTDVLVSTPGGQGDLALFKGVGKGLLSTTPQFYATGNFGNAGVPVVIVNLNADTAPDVAGVGANGFARILNTGVH